MKENKMSKLEVLIPEGYMNVGVNIEGTVLLKIKTPSLIKVNIIIL